MKTTRTRYWLHAAGPAPSTYTFKHDSYSTASARQREVEQLHHYEGVWGYTLAIETWEG